MGNKQQNSSNGFWRTVRVLMLSVVAAICVFTYSEHFIILFRRRISSFSRIAGASASVFTEDDGAVFIPVILYGQSRLGREGWDYGLDYNPFAKCRSKEWPLSQHADQVKVYHHLESPYWPYRGPNVDNYFNLTISYHLLADIQEPYVRVPSPSLQRNIPTSRKTKLAFWVVSHCEIESGRWGYYKGLSQHVSVDLFGACHPHHDDISFTQAAAYKFFLAFENSRCLNYVTEKAHRWGFDLGIVPIVRGSCREDYEWLLPPRSYILADDYTPEELGKYLRHLDQNDTAYNEFFTWRNNATSSRYVFPEGHGLCHLCDLIWTYYKPGTGEFSRRGTTDTFGYRVTIASAPAPLLEQLNLKRNGHKQLHELWDPSLQSNSDVTPSHAQSQSHWYLSSPPNASDVFRLRSNQSLAFAECRHSLACFRVSQSTFNRLSRFQPLSQNDYFTKERMCFTSPNESTHVCRSIPQLYVKSHS